MAPADLPAGVSPDCQNVAFIPGSVKTRPGLLNIFSPIAGNPTVNYLKTYIPQSGLLRLLALDAAGSLWKESSNGVLSNVATGIVANSFGKSASLFTREYLAIGDGQHGIDIPRQFDDTNFDRVSQVGPGAAPIAADESAGALALTASNSGVMTGSGTISAASEVGNICTVTFSISTDMDLLQPGDQVKIAGVGVGGYNGTFTVTANNNGLSVSYFNSTTGLAASSGGSATTPIAAINLQAAFFLPVGTSITVSGSSVAAYNGTWVVRNHTTTPATTASIYANIGTFGNANGNGGTLAVNGNVTAGLHKLSVVFQTRQGYITAPAPPNSWTAAGSKRVIVSGIPIGPPNVIARILLFTLAGQTFFFYTSGITGVAASNFFINDNTTTTVTVDFSDVGLSAQTSADSLFKKVELGECAGVIDYASRLFWWSERTKVQNFINLTFDGGFSGSVPLGWTIDTSNGTGGGSNAANAYWGFAYAITGDGATAIRGRIAQSAFQDSNGVVILQANTAYSIRVRLRYTGTAPAQGTFNAEIFSTSGGSLGTFTVNLTGLTTSYAESVGSLMASQATIPSDTVLRIDLRGTATNGTIVLIENIEIYPTNQPFNTSLIRASKVEDPETYDGVTGFMQINENDGQTVRSAFVLRENMYFVKDNYIGVTQDDGTNEPSLWKITEVSRKVGTPSVNGVAVGEDWAVIAHRSGLYITSGGEPQKISQEIQPTWDRINWNFGYKIWTQVDVQTKRIYIGVPLDSATSPNAILMMDYRGMNSSAEIAEYTPIHISYTGKLIVREVSRKWSIWTITANSAAIVERFDGTLKTFFGNGAGNGKIYQLTDSQLGNDDGAAVVSYYVTYYHFGHELEQAFQIGAHNHLYTYLAQFVEGNGQLVTSAALPGAVFPGGSTVTAASLRLANPGLRDLELPINVTATRAAFKIGVSNLNEWFRLARFIVDAVKHPTAPVRGWN